MSEYDDECTHSQGDTLDTHLETMHVDGPTGSLSELIYTATECNLIDSGISAEDAITIWKLVEMSKSFGDNCPQELRM